MTVVIKEEVLKDLVQYLALRPHHEVAHLLKTERVDGRIMVSLFGISGLEETVKEEKVQYGSQEEKDSQ